MMVFMMAAALAGLQPGKTVRLQPGTHQLIDLSGQSFDPPVTIDATGSVVKGVRLRRSKGINWRGGSIEAPAGKNGSGPNVYGVDIKNAQGISFDGVTFTNALRAIVIGDSRGITVRNSRFTGLRSDGIDIAGTSNVLIERNSFTDFSPVAATGIKGTPGWKDGDHPDAIQIWATKPNPANSDITVRNNIIEGNVQGINTFGWAGDGFSRIIVENNEVRIDLPPAIAVWNCSNCRIRYNKVSSLPGARFRANVTSKNSTGQFCDNKILSIPKNPANAKC